MANEKYAVNLLITELSRILSDEDGEPWYISSIIRPVIFGDSNWNDQKAKIALLKMTQVLDGYLKSNNLGKLEITK